MGKGLADGLLQEKALKSVSSLVNGLEKVVRQLSQIRLDVRGFSKALWHTQTHGNEGAWSEQEVAWEEDE